MESCAVAGSEIVWFVEIDHLASRTSVCSTLLLLAKTISSDIVVTKTVFTRSCVVAMGAVLRIVTVYVSVCDAPGERAPKFHWIAPSGIASLESVLMNPPFEADPPTYET